MSNNNTSEQQSQARSDRRGFLFTTIGGVIAALSGWLAGAFPRQAAPVQEEDSTSVSFVTRISVLEAEIAQLAQVLLTASNIQPLGQLEG